MHLGGCPGFQIFGSTNELTWFIDTLQKRPATTNVALVINGDFVDFVAQQPALPFDPKAAFDKLVTIAGDPNFQPIFQALQRFTATQGRQLFINLGNHDLELALPWVKEKFLTLVSGGDAAARGRITLSFNGFGGARQGRGAQVRCTDVHCIGVTRSMLDAN